MTDMQLVQGTFSHAPSTCCLHQLLCSHAKMEIWQTPVFGRCGLKYFPQMTLLLNVTSMTKNSVRRCFHIFNLIYLHFVA